MWSPCWTVKWKPGWNIRVWVCHRCCASPEGKGVAQSYQLLLLMVQTSRWPQVEIGSLSHIYKVLTRLRWLLGISEPSTASSISDLPVLKWKCAFETCKCDLCMMLHTMWRCVHIMCCLAMCVSMSFVEIYTSQKIRGLTIARVVVYGRPNIMLRHILTVAVLPLKL